MVHHDSSTLQTLDFGSDNRAPAHPAVLRAIARLGTDFAPAYGDDLVTNAVEARVSEIFERTCHVFPVTTGTAANSLALGCLSPSWGAIFCHQDAHIQVDECGAPELQTGGAKLIPFGEGADRIRLDTLRAAIGTLRPGDVHQVQGAALSLTQASEWGLVYSADEIRALTDIAKGHGLRVHMDGARFANAVVRTGASPADLTWRAGVDVLCFGATKDGALAAEAVVFFDDDLAQTFAYRRKRAGHLLSKMRFVSVQLEAMLANGLWLDCARHANAMAARLADGLGTRGVPLVCPAEANMVFARLREEEIDQLEQAGVNLFRWPPKGQGIIRLVCSFATTVEQVDGLLTAVDRARA